MSVAATATRRLLRSPLADLLLGPYGVDRYLELIRPELTVHEARARVVAVRRQTPRSVTLTLRPNQAWAGFTPGQFVRVGVEIDGVRRTRTYSPASAPGARDGLLELTVSVHPGGAVSTSVNERVRTGAVLHLGRPEGEFVLPDPVPERLVLISGGSGITPVMSMLRALCAQGHRGRVAFLHYGRTRADWLYHDDVAELSARHPNLSVRYVATREGGRHIDAQTVREALGNARVGAAHAAVCGPPELIEAVRAIWAQAPERVLAETFTPPALSLPGDTAEGTVRFLRSERTAAIAQGTLLEQAEAAGLAPEFGCRMGICHTCTCRKRAGAVRNVLTGETSAEEDEDIQLCVSVPAGDVALEL